MIEGVFDQDVYDAANLINEVGDLTKIYNIAPRNDYSIETMQVHSFTPPEGILDGAYDIIQEFKEGVGVVSYNLVLDPSVYADQLAKGETEVLSFSYIVSDGTNDVTRTFDFTIKGANEFNEPSFDKAVIDKVVYTNENPQLVDLLEGVTDPEGDKMTLVDLVASTPEEYVTNSSLLKPWLLFVIVLLVVLTTLVELPLTDIESDIPSAFVYIAISASKSDAFVIAVFTELHTSLQAVLYAVTFEGIAADVSDFLVTYQSVLLIPEFALVSISDVLLAFNVVKSLAVLLFVITTVPASALYTGLLSEL